MGSDLIERAREIVAKDYERFGDYSSAKAARAGSDDFSQVRCTLAALTAAADEITALRDRVAALEGALAIIAARPTHEGGCYYNNKFSVLEARAILATQLDAAKPKG